MLNINIDLKKELNEVVFDNNILFKVPLQGSEQTEVTRRDSSK